MPTARWRVYRDPQRAGLELAAAMPFERRPGAGCPPAASERPSRGVLLLHGLADMPLAMRDPADAFAARCFVVRVMLLPGHGTRAGDLLDVTRADWRAVARCLAAEHPWRGAVFGDNTAAIPDAAPFARPTFNPRFAELLEQVDEFLTASSF